MSTPPPGSAPALPPPGWHPDPTDPGGGQLRWWDGSTWTDQTRVAASLPPPAWAPPAHVSPYSPSPVQATFARRNRYSLVCLGFVAAYLVLTFALHIVVLGIVPALMAFRAVRAREALWPVAVLGAGLAIAIAVAALG